MLPITTIGIDPSLRNIGLCILTKQDGKTSQKTLCVIPKNLKDSKRLAYISRQVTEFLAAQQSCLVVIESYDYRGHNLAQLGEVTGILQLLCENLGFEILMASPASIKKFATGNSQATKELIMEKYSIDNEHIADARAMAELAYAYITEDSKIRHELEVIKQLKTPKKKKVRRKKVNLHAVAI